MGIDELIWIIGETAAAALAVRTSGQGLLKLLEDKWKGVSYLREFHIRCFVGHFQVTVVCKLLVW
jgi:sulfur relay (sulfurtransferase) DsrC/TusE family protein